MKAIELKIGNYVCPDGDLTQEYQVCEQDFVQDTFNRLSGIVLTEKWIQKLGFRLVPEKQSTFSRTWRKYNLEIDDYINAYSFFMHPITTVHQLQNLYFTLTGEELTV